MIVFHELSGGLSLEGGSFERSSARILLYFPGTAPEIKHFRICDGSNGDEYPI